MEIFWVFLMIGLTFAEKLDRTYLPPPGSLFSGGSPGAIRVPFQLPKTKYSYNDVAFSGTPKLVGIDRVGPNQEEIFNKLMSTHKPKVIYNGDSLTPPTKTTSSVFKQPLNFNPFPKLEENSKPTLPEVNNLDYPSIDFDNLQQIYNVEKHPRISVFDEKNRVYLPSFGRDIDNEDHVYSITLPSAARNENIISDKYKYIQPNSGSDEDASSNDQQFNILSSTLLPNYPNGAKNNILPQDYHSSNAFQFSTTTPISPTKTGSLIFNHVGNQKPERIQAQADRQAVIFNYEQSVTPEGYAYSYDTSNGIHGDEAGIATNGVKAKGSYSYVGDDGKFYQIEYTADENGFVPKGAHLPTAPPIPDAILRVIAQATNNKDAGVYDDGFYDEKKYGYKKYEGRYPNFNDVVNEADITSENENDDNFGKFGDSNEQVRIDNLKKIQEIEFGDIDSTRINRVNYANNNVDENNILPPESIVLNKNYQDPSSQSPIDVSISNKNGEINPHTASGYEYFPPKSPFFDAKKMKSFSSRFSGKDTKVINEYSTEKVTAKPFFTRYVTRKGDDLEINDYDEQSGQDTDIDEEPFENSNKENKGDVPNGKPINRDSGNNSREFNSKQIPEQQQQYGDRIQNAHQIPSNNERNIYQNENKSFIILNPRVSYTTATPIEFPSDISTQSVNRTPGRDSLSFRVPALSNIPLLIETSTKLSISSLPTQTKNPVIIDKESKSLYPDASSKTDILSTAKSIQTLKPVPGDRRFGVSYRLTTEGSVYTDVYNGQTSTENTIGEDFTGPKQPQRFDPITGYHY